MILLEWYFRILNKESIKFCDSSCIILSFPFLLSTYAFPFTEEFAVLIEFLEVEN